jgi:hypothetical protein
VCVRDVFMYVYTPLLYHTTYLVGHIHVYEPYRVYGTTYIHVHVYLDDYTN